MRDQGNINLQHLAAERAAQRAFFLAGDLVAYRTLHELGEVDLAKWLGCAPERLVKLALCRRPDPGSLTFRAEVEKIAGYVGVQPERLAQLLREIEAASAFRRAEGAAGERRNQGMLLAARDHVEEERDEREGPERTPEGRRAEQ